MQYPVFFLKNKQKKKKKDRLKSDNKKTTCKTTLQPREKSRV